MKQLSIALLGSFQVTLSNEAVTYFASDSARALLAYLAMHQGTAHRRDALAGLLWPEHPNTEALRNLRVALSRLRDAIGDREAGTPFLEITRRTIQINLYENSTLDVQRMLEALADTKTHAHLQYDPCDICAKQLETAVSLYRGEFLSGFAFDSVPFEEWLVVERENLHWQALEALYALANYHEKKGDFDAVIDCARRQVELEPWRETAHRQWMRALALSGHRNAALTQYEVCRKILSDELGVEPEAETVILYKHIRDGDLAPHPTVAGKPAINDAPVEIQPTSGLTESLNQDESSQHPHLSLRPESELRTITVVQAEVQGTDTLPVVDDDEEWAVKMGQLLRAAGVEVHRYGGEVDHYKASGLVAMFGTQVSHEDDPERAVLAALAVQKTFYAQLLQLNNETRESPGRSSGLDMRIALDTGDAIITTMDDDSRTGQRAVVGDVVISTNRLLSETIIGKVQVSEATYRLVSTLFEWDSQDSLTGYIPLTHISGADKGRGIPGIRSVLVGRQREFRTLREVVEKLESGIGGIVTLMGEAGIGKSRLVSEVKKSTGIKWVEGRCLSYSGTIAYALWQSILRALFEVTVDTPSAIIGYALRKHMRGFDTESFKLNYACLGRLLALPMDADSEKLVAQMDAGNLKNATFNAVKLLLESISRQKPLVIVCEDLHWADPTSLALLDYVLGLTDRVPLLFVCIFRPQREHGCWQIRETALLDYPHRHIDMQLDPLTTSESKKLLENLLLSMPGPGGRKPVEGLPDALKSAILTRGEGNPFFVEEILRALIRSGAIFCDVETCQWQAGMEVESIGIPESLYGVLRTRIDQLPIATQHILQLASVIGRTFTHPLLAAIAEQESLTEHLVTLQREQLIRKQADLPEVVYIFQHQLTLEAVYGGLLHRVRRVLHRRVAEAVEKLYPDRVEAQVGLLAHHWEKAGDKARAVAYRRQVD